MKEIDEIDKLFENVDGQMDLLSPSVDHKLRFAEKLKHQNTISPKEGTRRVSYKPLLAIAASITLFCCLGLSLYVSNKDVENNLANISPEMEHTQNFFTMAIESHLEEINKKASESNKKLIEDTLKQLEKLEANYVVLQKDLVESRYDRRVISAMINNFQKRISLLESVLEKIDNINELKIKENENNIL